MSAFVTTVHGSTLFAKARLVFMFSLKMFSLCLNVSDAMTDLSILSPPEGSSVFQAFENV